MVRQKVAGWARAALFVSVAVVATACLFAVQTSAEDMSDSRRDSIVQSCDSMKSRIKQLQTSDASIRVTLGQNYESILTKLMDTMNARLATNRIDSGELPTIAAEFDRNLGYFRKNYISYDQKIDDLRKANCNENPESFYRQLESARNLRGALRLNYTRLNELIDRYRAELNSVLKGGDAEQ
ncbi:MAG: hypothetical protein LBH36_02910 [Candidatus Nomurabacteria bacterium]|jgi:hypothetical protein|nr:hypothetical protein [Candidatus Nomurabacteria bacterium]